MDKTVRKNYRGEEKYRKDINETVGVGLDLIDSLFKRYLSL